MSTESTLADSVPAPATTAAAAATTADQDLPKNAPAALVSTVSSVLAPAKESEYNRTGIDYSQPMPRPKVHGLTIDCHTHLFAARHARAWFQCCDHFGIDACLTMAPLEEAIGLQRDWGHRLKFIAVPAWGDQSSNWMDNWLVRLEAFYNLGSRVVKFHSAPGTMASRGVRLDHPKMRRIMDEAVSRGMILMSHVGDPDTWYNGKYAQDPGKYGNREADYQMWEYILSEYKQHHWWGAHFGGNPENLPRLQQLLNTYPKLMFDMSATRWIVREISARRDAAREFVIRNQDRLMWGSDQVSGNDRGFDFMASRWWAHRKLWETALIAPSPIYDPDLPLDNQVTLRGLALPDDVLQKIYHDNITKLLNSVGVRFDQLSAAA